MKIVAIVQARMSSRRLAGKVLKKAGGRPMLMYLYERLRHCRCLDDIVISTSRHATDDPIEAFCRSHGIQCFRGPLEDVAGRFAATVERYGCDGFVRVNGDSPLLDQRLIDHAVTLMRSNTCDLVTNVFPRSFPAGQSVEVLRGDAFQAGYVRMSDPADLEHVTRYFYRHSEDFAILNFDCHRDYRRCHFAVDTDEDFQRCRTILQSMARPHWEYDLAQLAGLYATSVLETTGGTR